MNLMLILGSLVALHGGEPSHEPHPSNSMVVRVRDLDLHTISGSATAVQRINAAARAFCAERAGGAQVVDVTVLKCRRDIGARAVERLRSDRVRALYQEAPGGVLLYAGRG